MQTRSAAFNRQLAAAALKAAAQGGRALEADKKQLRSILSQPDPARRATEETLDGLLGIYEKNSRVVMAIKQATINNFQAGAVVNTTA